MSVRVTAEGRGRRGGQGAASRHLPTANGQPPMLMRNCIRVVQRMGGEEERVAGSDFPGQGRWGGKGKGQGRRRRLCEAGVVGRRSLRGRGAGGDRAPGDGGQGATGGQGTGGRGGVVVVPAYAPQHERG